MEPVLKHYLQTSSYTDLGLFHEVINKLPDDIREIGLLVRKQLLHGVVLKNGNIGTNLKNYGDVTKVPWWRQPEDDIFVTAASIVNEIYRLDSRGFVLDRKAENKPVITCRGTAVLMAAILKAKNIPVRVRSGFAPYFTGVEGLPAGKSDDHWINQYFSLNDNYWVTIDVDGSLEYLKFDPYNIPQNTFDFSADAWLAVRGGKISENHFINAGGAEGLIAISWELFYDFHCLMNHEVIYQHTPEVSHFGKFEKLTKEQLEEIDNLARFMQNPDKNFEQLKNIWDTKKEYRLVKGGVI